MAIKKEEIVEVYIHAFRKYKDYILTHKPIDHRSFIEHQNACKAALAHLLLLVKFLNLESSPEGSEDISQLDKLEILINESAEALNIYFDHES